MSHRQSIRRVGTSFVWCWIVLAVFVVGPAPLRASDNDGYILYELDNPPWGSSKTRDGFVSAIVKTAFERAGISYREVFVPWKRGQQQVENSDNGFLAPITRLPHREHKYKWVAPVNISRLHLVTRNPVLAEAKWQDLLGTPVVARMASPAQYLLEDLGFEDITVVANEMRAARMIMADRVQVWMQRGLPGNWAYHNAGGDIRALKQIESWQTPLQYLIASHGVPDKVIIKLGTELKAMRQEGELDRIKRSYFPFPISCNVLFACLKEPVEAGGSIPAPGQE